MGCDEDGARPGGLDDALLQRLQQGLGPQRSVKVDDIIIRVGRKGDRRRARLKTRSLDSARKTLAKNEDVFADHIKTEQWYGPRPSQGRGFGR